MGHRAARRDVMVAVRHDAGCAMASTNIGGASAVHRAVVALRAAGAKLQHRASLGSAGDAAGLGGDQRLMVDGEQDHGFHELRLNHGTGHGDKGFAGENRRTLRHGPYIAREFKFAQVIEKGFREAAAAAQVGDILLGEMQVFEIVDQLFHARHDGVAAAVRHAAEEHVEISAAVGDAFFKVPVRHCELVKVGQHGQIFFGHCENAPLRMDAMRFYSIRASVLTQCIYSYNSTFLRKVQDFLSEYRFTI